MTTGEAGTRPGPAAAAAPGPRHGGPRRGRAAAWSVLLPVAVTGLVLAALAIRWSASHGVLSRVLVATAAGVVVLVLAGLLDRLLPAHGRRADRIAAAVVVGLAVATRLPVSLSIESTPFSDFLAFYGAALDFAAGGDPFGSDYFSTWAYQTGFTLYEAALLKVFGGVTALLVANVLWMSGTCVLLYLCARRIGGHRAAALGVALLYVLYPGTAAYASVLTNQHIGAFLFYLGIVFLLRSARPGPARDVVLWVVAGGAAIAVANIMRPLGPVFLGAAALAEVVLLVQGHHGLRRAVLRAAGLVVPYLAVGALAGWAVAASGVNPHGLGNHLPEWKFAVGLNADSGGGYSRELSARVFEGGSPEVWQARTRDVVREELAELPRVWPRLFAAKLTEMYGKPDSWTWALSDQLAVSRDDRGPWAAFAYTMSWIERGIFLLVTGLCAASCVLLLRRHRLPYAATLLGLVVVLYVGAHLIVEIQTRYRYELMPALFALAAPAVARLLVLARARRVRRSSLHRRR